MAETRGAPAPRPTRRRAMPPLPRTRRAALAAPARAAAAEAQVVSAVEGAVAAATAVAEARPRACLAVVLLPGRAGSAQVREQPLSPAARIASPGVRSRRRPTTLPLRPGCRGGE